MRAAHISGVCTHLMCAVHTYTHLVSAESLHGAGERSVPAEGDRGVLDAATEPHLADPAPWPSQQRINALL